MERQEGRDYFDKARTVAAALLFGAGIAAVGGAFLEWVTIQPPERVPADQANRLDAFTGMDTSDGWVVVALAGAILLSALFLVIRKRSLYAWIAFWCSMVMGGISIADYRGIDELFYEEMNRIGDPSPAFGLTLVAVAALVGIVASVTGVAASPKRDEEQP
ncbi:MAG TPA: hypothetical protein VE174_01375 [Actinomycetota bacterium]|nr:hypothetical protein [Actinomycetota bacterium]